MQDVRGTLLQHIANMVEYWSEVGERTPRERSEGLACSILIALDGASSVVPKKGA